MFVIDLLEMFKLVLFLLILIKFLSLSYLLEGTKNLDLEEIMEKKDYLNILKLRQYIINSKILKLEFEFDF